MLSNHITLIGHLGAKPASFDTKAGQTFATARLAVSKSYKDKHDNYVQDTQWFRLTGWGRQGKEMIAQLSTGDRVCFTGSLSCRSYETKAGDKRESVEIIVSSFEVLPRLSARKTALVEIVADAEVDEELALETALPF